MDWANAPLPPPIVDEQIAAAALPPPIQVEPSAGAVGARSSEGDAGTQQPNGDFLNVFRGYGSADSSPGTQRNKSVSSPSLTGESDAAAEDNSGGAGGYTRPRKLSRAGTLSKSMLKTVDEQELRVLALQSQSERNFGTLNTKKIRSRYQKTMRNSKSSKEMKAHVAALEKGEKTTNPKLGNSKIATLQTIAAEAQENVMRLITAVNASVLDPRTFREAEIGEHISKICEVLQMLLILTDGVEGVADNATIKGLVGSLTGYLDVMSKHRVVNEKQVKAAATPAGQLVVTELVEDIHNQLAAVKTLSLQVTCIIRFIAHVDIGHNSLVQLVATINAFTVGMRELWSAVLTLMHIKNKGITASSEDAEDHESTWAESVSIDSLPQNGGGLKVGNLNQIVNKICGNTSNKHLLRTIVMSHRSFTHSRVFLSKLESRYRVPESESAEAASAIKSSVADVLHFWIHNFLADFDEHMIGRVDSFLLDMIEDPVTKDTATKDYKFLEEQVGARKARRLVWFAQNHDDKIEVLAEGISLSDLVLEIPGQIIADQLTAIDWKLYCSLEPIEFLQQNWSKEATQHRSPNLCNFIRRNTRISHWVATMVLSQDDQMWRTRMIEKMIEICQALEGMNNYNTLMGIVAGLNLACIGRLSKAKRKVDKKLVKSLKTIMHSMSTEGSHKLYRDRIKRAKPPAIPYMAVSLIDLTFIDDGNDDLVDGLINVEKAKLTADNITQLLVFQQTAAYQIRELEPLYSFLQEMPLLNEDELYNISLQLEPRAPAGKKDKQLDW